jgi:hypothetical protein
VKRFYVLNYLNRYGEMWELFSNDLRERLGGDRRDYVKSSRRSGFELYSSSIETVRVKGDVGSVVVVVQAQLAGSLDVTNRRHRMLWRFQEGDWRYSGSIDVTHAEDDAAPVAAADLQPPSRAQAQEVPPQELLPPRVRVDARAPKPSAQERRATAGTGERWDLVAVPPPGRVAPGSAATTPVVATPTSPPATPPAGAAASPPAVVVAETAPAEPEWLPPERASAPPPPPAAAPGEERAGSVAEYDEGTRLVRKAVSGLLPRRMRALTRLRSLNEPRLAPLMAESLPEAPPATIKGFLAELTRYRAFGECDAVVEVLRSRDSDLRAAAARALVVLGDASHQAALETALDSEVDDAAFAQELLAFAAVSGETAGPRLAATLGDEGAGPATRAAAARAAGACGCEGVEEPLLALLRRERDASVTRFGLPAAGRLGGEESIALLDDVAERRLRLPAEQSDDLDGVLEARRGLAISGEADSGEALAALLLSRGMRASSEDVVLVAATGERDALLSLLAHPEPAVRRRTADLMGRVIETDEDAEAGLAAIATALVDEGDTVALDALLDARERLRDRPST